MNMRPAFEQPRRVLGVDRSLPAVPIGFVNPQAGIFTPALIEKVDLPIRECGPHQSGKRADDTAEIVFHDGPSLPLQSARMRPAADGRPLYLGIGRRLSASTRFAPATNFLGCSALVAP